MYKIMVTVRDVEQFLDKMAPFASALDFDNVGLLVGSGEQTAERTLVALDITPPVVEEAERLGAGLVVSHHPVIFRPIKRLDADDVPYRLARAGIAALCAHTNLDMAPGGVNDTLAKELGLRNTRCLSAEATQPFWKVAVFVPESDARAVSDAMTAAGAGRLNRYRDCTFSTQGVGTFLPMEGAHPAVGSPGERTEVSECRVEMLCSPDCLSDVLRAMRRAHPYEEPAFDVLPNHAVEKTFPGALAGEMDQPMEPQRFARHVKERLHCEGVRWIKGDRPVRTVGLCGGAGGDQIFDAIDQGLDAYVTGEIKHHELLAAAHAGITVVDAGHFRTEQVVVPRLVEVLRERFPGMTVTQSTCCTDGVHYL